MGIEINALKAFQLSLGNVSTLYVKNMIREIFGEDLKKRKKSELPIIWSNAPTGWVDL